MRLPTLRRDASSHEAAPQLTTHAENLKTCVESEPVAFAALLRKLAASSVWSLSGCCRASCRACSMVVGGERCF